MQRTLFLETNTLRPKLAIRWQSIENQKAVFISYLNALSEDALTARATPVDWSLLEVLEHVIIVEEWVSAPFINSEGKRVGMKAYLFTGLGGAITRSGIRIPTLPVAEPSGTASLNDLIERWARARQSLAPKLLQVTASRWYAPIALHPFAGPMNAYQVMGLLDVHLAYHLRHSGVTTSDKGAN